MTPFQETLVRDVQHRLGRLATQSCAPWHLGLQAIEEGHLRWLCLRHDGRQLGWVFAFSDEAPGRLMPTTLQTADGRARWPVQSIRAPRAMRQSTAVMRNTNTIGARGALAAIVQSSSTGQLFAMTAAHVLAGRAEASIADDIDIDGQFLGKLSNWLPVLGSPAVQTPVDAGIAEITPEAAQALRQRYPHLRINRTGSLIYLDQPLRIHACKRQIDARYRGAWSGWIDAPEFEGQQNYWLENGWAYQASDPTEPGDSGSALIDESEQIVGMHCAGVSDSGVSWNALGCRMEAALELLGCRMGAAAPSPRPAMPIRAEQPAQAPRLGDTAPRPEEDVLARTLWGEARGERDASLAMKAVANVVLNRRRKNTWWGKTITEVCRKPWQFSCWNAGDPNLSKLLRVESSDRQFAIALGIARQAVSGDLGSDPTQGATHYYADSLHTVPTWARGRSPCALIGRHRFYRDID